MDLEFSETHRAVIDAMASAVSRNGDRINGSISKYELCQSFKGELREQGFLDIVSQEELGLLGGLLVIEGAARSPYCLELTGSILVWPHLGLEVVPETVALAQSPLRGPVRFASDGVALIVLSQDKVELVELTNAMVRNVESHFAYPLGSVAKIEKGVVRALDVDPEEVRMRWRLGAVMEITGAASAALDLTVQHVKDRILFGKPLGSLQVIQHRLSICAVAIAGAQRLAYRTALRPTPASAAVALAHAQRAAMLVSTECQQFHGAIGLTLEHPIHHWTYRLKYLATELGGGPANFASAAEGLWPDDEEIVDPLAQVDMEWV